MSALESFTAATRGWFEASFASATPAQLGAWEAISKGRNALVIAPTGSGKTLASFLWAIDRLVARPVGGTGSEGAAKTDAAAPPADTPKGTRVLYISPLKALGVDVERNLRSPLAGVLQTAARLGEPAHPVTVGVRSGDTPASERRQLLTHPPDILITTPESLFLMLTSQARETLRTVTTVIVDEVHAVASTKRGAHLALSMERLDALLEQPAQRIGLSATVRPAEEVARFLGGTAPVEIVSPPIVKEWDLRVVVPVDDMTNLPGREVFDGVKEGSAAGNVIGAPGGREDSGSIWPHVEESILEKVLEVRSTIVFANSRRLAERLTARLNELYDRALELGASHRDAATPAPSELRSLGSSARTPSEVSGGSGATRGSTGALAKAHHGSVSREQRALIEDDLKTGRLRCVVATSSLELGIDMGAVDRVIQVETPPSVASGLQRVGRAGHSVGEVSHGLLYPKHRADLLHSAVVGERMRQGLIEQMVVPANPLDVLAQQTVAACALEPLVVEEWFDQVRRSAPFAALPRSAFDAVLDLLSGRYPSDEFAELRPRVVWDREAGTLTGRPGAQRLAVTSGGTIPDRGLFGVWLVGEKPTRVGELDEEMVYESRVQDVIALGATSWRIQEITHDRVLVTPAFGEPGRLPFWRGDAVGRPVELGRAIGAFVRELSGSSEPQALERLTAAGLDERAAANLRALIQEQQQATGQLPTDQGLVVERFRDELGDWRLVLHSPLGLRVHAPWSLAVAARVRERYGLDGNAVPSDDGIVLRLPDTETEPPGAELFVFDPDELDAIVTQEVGGSALFAARFRENAARALLLPRRNPGRRSPLWQQRQRSAQLLDVARDHPSFPIILETVRECLQDVYDLPALLDTVRRLGDRSLRLAEVETETPSPFAKSLLFGYVGAFLYEGDSPLAERRAAALSLDTALLGELLGRIEVRELLDPAVVELTERELQRLEPGRRLQGVEGAADLLRMLGPLSIAEAAARLRPGVATAGTDGVSGTPEPGADDADAAEPDAPHATEAEALTHLDSLVTQRRAIRLLVGGEDRFAAVEDAARLRDALGAPLPLGIPQAFLAAVADPLGDLVSRYARTHGPFTTEEVAARFGLGVAVVQQVLLSLGSERRVSEGEFRPGGHGQEWCEAEVLRRLRARSLAALRKEVEPVAPVTLARFLPAWQHVGGALRGVDGVAAVIEQLAGCAAPASAWESLILPARIPGYHPSMLDELTTSGEVLWRGHSALAGGDGWLSFHLADRAELTLPKEQGQPQSSAQVRVLELLGQGGGWFFRQLADALAGASETRVDDDALADELWQLAWAGLVTNDTLTPLRSRLSGKGGATVAQRASASRRTRSRGFTPTRQGPPGSAGRWSLVPSVDRVDDTARAAALGEQLVDRYGVVTKGSVVTEGVPGAYGFVYRLLSGFEDRGLVRRGYYVEGLGAAQFAAPATVDRLRAAQPGVGAVARSEGARVRAVALAATDPANPYGAALPWPEREGHRPGRKAGAVVVLVDGELGLYLEKGGKSILPFLDDEEGLEAAAGALADVVRTGALGRITLERAAGQFILDHPLAAPLRAHGFQLVPRGLRLGPPIGALEQRAGSISGPRRDASADDRPGRQSSTGHRGW